MISNLKIRISLWYAGLSTIILAVTLFAAFRIMSFQLTTEVKEKLHDKIALIEQEIIHKQKIDNDDFRQLKKFVEEPDTSFAVLAFLNKKLVHITPRFRAHAHHLNRAFKSSDTTHTIRSESSSFLVNKIYESGYTIFIGYHLSAIEQLQRKLFHIFLILFPISLLLSVLCAFLVTQQTMNIIKQIDDTARDITTQNLNQRIPSSSSNDEISQLIVTLNSMIDRLEKSFTQANQFSQDAAHEIRTPLTIIRGEIEELIEHEQTNTTTTKTLENVLEEIQYLISISQRLLLIHNQDTNNMKYHFESIDFTQLINEIYQDAQILSSEKDIAISLDIDEQITINGNKELLTRLLWNICDNAVKYNHTNGTIAITVYTQSNYVSIEISDNGIGIAPSDQSKIFDRFYRVDKSRSRQLGGSGLGLAICKWIAELHGGSISLKSEIHNGSTFIIQLPKNSSKA
ncbi:HAMP domain-containing protein [Prolixibacteraceae bacterium JC049]|nr:HAMP domain-containing protein [Prolixibacteraceae bacterium JC049]